jgi:hypothetical protein
VPAVLVHECICHVAAGHGTARSDSVFSEGLMDWVSTFFLDRWAPAIDSAMAHAARVHGRRLCEVSATRGPADAARPWGHDAAQAIVMAMSSRLRMPSDSCAWFLARLLVELNALKRPWREKERFARGLATSADSVSGALMSVLEKYVQRVDNGCPEDLLLEVLQP